MNRFLLDTSIIIDYLRGRGEQVALVDTLDGELVSSSICMAELYEGVYRVTNPEDVLSSVEQFFAGLSAVYPVDQAIAREFGRLRASLHKEGERIEDLDVVIAATAIAHQCTVVTKNVRDFIRIPHLRVHGR